MPTAVIFDVDGTLIDSVDQHAHAWQEALRHFGHTFELSRVRQLIGKGSDQLLPSLLPPEVLKSEYEELDEYRGKLFKSRYFLGLKPFLKVRELFERCRRAKLRIALASSAKSDELAHYAGVAGVADLIDAKTSSDDAAKSKPHPDIFLAALEALGGPDPAGVVVVGDTPYDAEAAGRAGLSAVGLLCGGFPEEQLRGAGCVAIYRDPADLLGDFDRSPLAG